MTSTPPEPPPPDGPATEPPEPADHAAAATRYCRRIVAGEIPACKWTRLACQRQLDDLAKALSDPDWPYYFDRSAANRICKFIELLPHVKGKWARRDPADPTAHLIRLGAWQKFILTTVFGWKRHADGTRRFRKVYEEVARKNAKSTILSGVALYMLALDGEEGAEVYSAATKRDQAKIVFGAAQAMARKCTDFRVRFGIEVFAHSIAQPSSGSSFLALDAMGKTQDGYNVHFVSNDELHAHKSRELYDVLDSATGSREQPLVWNVTTAGTNTAGICYEQRIYLCKLLEGTLTDETYFGVIYTIDDGDDWTDPACWPKANPNLGVSKSLATMEEDCAKARASSASQNNFLRKHLDVWVGSATAWMNMLLWRAQARPGLSLDDFEGEPCILALDLATKTDIASKAYLFQRGGDHYLFCRHYLPQAAIDDSRNAHYEGWAADGWIDVTPGAVTDLDRIEEEIVGGEGVIGHDTGRFSVTEIAYDPFQCMQLAGHLEEAGATAVELGATVRNFSEPMKELEALVLTGRLFHQDDPVLNWMMSNVVAFLDRKDNVYPRKEIPENKIDGPVAAIMALARAMVHREDTGTIYDQGAGVMVV